MHRPLLRDSYPSSQSKLCRPQARRIYDGSFMHKPDLPSGRITREENLCPFFCLYLRYRSMRLCISGFIRPAGRTGINGIRVKFDDTASRATIYRGI
jgi:hypothetical protein